MTVARAWVLLHGTPLNPDVWSELSPALGSQPVLAPIVTPTANDRHPQLTVAQRLAIELPLVADRWDVVGHSFGGQIALELALLAPARVATLSVICSRDTPFPPFARRRPTCATAIRSMLKARFGAGFVPRNAYPAAACCGMRANA